MSLELSISAELELRRRKREGIVLNAPEGWADWLSTLFPKHFTASFAKRHIEFWEWVESIEKGVRPRPFIGLWGRGGAKSTNAEGAAIKVAARGMRKYCWYVCSTQEKADQHVDTISAMLENSETNKYYPELSDRAVNKFGNSKGWRRSRLRTASGFTIDALGLDTGTRGAKEEEQRPDFICHEIGTQIFTDNTWMSVEDHYSAGVRNGAGYKINVWGLPFPEIVTNEHRYWTRSITPIPKSNKYRTSSDDWCEAKNLTTRHYLGLPIDSRIGTFQPIPHYQPKIGERNGLGQVVRGISNYEEKIPDEFHDKEWWWFFGLWWGDGHAVGRYIVGITIANSQPEIYQRAKSLFEKWNIKYNIAEKSGCRQLTFSHAVFCRWLKSWRVGNSRKQPPQWVEYLPLSHQKELICGYIDSDGFIDRKAVAIRITSIHLDGLLCVRRMLARFGISASIRKGVGPRKEIFPNGITSISQTKYDLRFRDGASRLGFDIENSRRYSFNRTFCEAGYLWTRVRDIQLVENRIFVPITTEDHEYLTHFGKSHNCIDDVDELFDSFATTQKKIKILTQSVLPAGSIDCAVLFIQNLIHPDSIASRLADGRADFLTDRIVSGPHPAIVGLTYEQGKDGKFYITAGAPTWEGQDLATCQAQINTWGLSAFLKEAQHEVEKGGGLWEHVVFRHIAFSDLPEFIRTAVWVDPAISETDESDSMGIAAGGITRKKDIIGIYWWEGITSPEDALERAIEKAVEIKALHVGVETDQGGDTWKSVYTLALAKVKSKLRGRMSAEVYNKISWPKFTSRKAGGMDESTGHAYGSKVERNAKMLADYERGQVVHMIGTHVTIEKALWRFPKKPLDVADSHFWLWDDLRNKRQVGAW